MQLQTIVSIVLVACCTSLTQARLHHQHLHVRRQAYGYTNGTVAGPTGTAASSVTVEAFPSLATPAEPDPCGVTPIAPLGTGTGSSNHTTSSAGNSSIAVVSENSSKLSSVGFLNSTSTMDSTSTANSSLAASSVPTFSTLAIPASSGVTPIAQVGTGIGLAGITPSIAVPTGTGSSLPTAALAVNISSSAVDVVLLSTLVTDSTLTLTLGSGASATVVTTTLKLTRTFTKTQTIYESEPSDDAETVTPAPTFTSASNVDYALSSSAGNIDKAATATSSDESTTTTTVSSTTIRMVTIVPNRTGTGSITGTVSVVAAAVATGTVDGTSNETANGLDGVTGVSESAVDSSSDSSSATSDSVASVTGGVFVESASACALAVTVTVTEKSTVTVTATPSPLVAPYAFSNGTEPSVVPNNAASSGFLTMTSETSLMPLPTGFKRSRY